MGRRRLTTTTAIRRFGASVTPAEETIYRYDVEGRLDYQSTLVDTAKWLTRDLRYDALGRVDVDRYFIETSSPNGVWNSSEAERSYAIYEYDLNDRRRHALENFDADNNGTFQASESQDFWWTYDRAGRLTSERVGAAGTSLTDYVDRYFFDLAGNRTRKEHSTAQSSEITTYSYDHNDRLRSETKNGQTTTYGYGTGDLQTVLRSESKPGSPTTNYTYDERGRLITVATGGTTTTYEYNEGGERVKQNTTTYLVDSHNPTGYSQVLEEKSVSTVTRSYTLGADVISQATSTSKRHLLYDLHGSTRGLIQPTGAFATTPTSQIFRYDAYGNRLDGNTADTTLLYSGEWTDASGWQYLRERYYKPSIGRFGALDPFAGNIDSPLSPVEST